MLSFDLSIAVRTLWMEARGEPDDGMRAVGHVLLNRVHDGRWGNNLAAVCLAPLQFSCWNTMDVNRREMSLLADNDPSLAHATNVFMNCFGEVDPTSGAKWYYSIHMTMPPSWTNGATFLGRFGNQNFYKDVH